MLSRGGFERERCQKTCRRHVYSATRPPPQRRSNPSSAAKGNSPSVRMGCFSLSGVRDSKPHTISIARAATESLRVRILPPLPRQSPSYDTIARVLFIFPIEKVLISRGLRGRGLQYPNLLPRIFAFYRRYGRDLEFSICTLPLTFLTIQQKYQVLNTAWNGLKRACGNGFCRLAFIVKI